MTKRQKVILIAGLIIVILAGLLIWALSRTSEKGLLQENPNLPKDEWTKVTIRGGDEGYKTITNKSGGYEIIVPASWNIAEVATKSSGYEIKFEDLFLRIFTLNTIEQAKLFFPPSARFEDKEIPAGLAYRTSFQASQDILDDRGNLVEMPIENSLVVGHLIPSKEKVYLISCFASGNNFKELISLCEKQILTFKILK